MDKIKIRAMILDYGGVISQPQNAENVNNILQSLKQDHNDFMEVYRGRRAQYDSGQISGEKYWVNILRHYGLEPNGFDIARLIQEDVRSWTQINEAMIQFITESRGKIHKLAVISNMTSDSLAFIKKHHRWPELFDELILSCEIGINKPDRQIYETCLRKLNVYPNECLFVDDSLENVKGAIDVGMYAIQFKTFSEFQSELSGKYCITQ
jgi:putative hydrolase of the HAD superfamily